MSKKEKPPKAGYDVGYGKPPRQTQFKPGQSGNPKGRPRGQPGFAELLIREASRLVKVETAVGIQTFTRAEVVIRKVFQAASAGDLQAGKLILSYLERTQIEQEAADEAAASTSFKIPDEEAIGRILARLMHLQPASEADE